MSFQSKNGQLVTKGYILDETLGLVPNYAGIISSIIG